LFKPFWIEGLGARLLKYLILKYFKAISSKKDNLIIILNYIKKEAI
jgi:hypothetical protein